MRSDVPDGVVTRSHRVETLVESWLGTERLAPVPVDDGLITYTYGAKVPGRLELTVPGDFIPRHRHSPLAALGQRLRVVRVMHDESGPYPLNLGWFLIQGWETDERIVDVEAVSLEQIVADYRFEQAYQPSGGTTYLSVIKSILQGLLPVAWDGTLSSRTVDSGRLWEESRIDCLHDLASDWGADVRVDPDGVLTISAESRVQATPHRRFRHGERDAYVTVSTAGMRDEVYNAVVARGEANDGTPVQAIAVDNRSSSPTYYYGPFGRRQRFYESQFISTVAQAKSAAEAMLRRELLRTSVVTIEAPPDPRLELGDTIEVVTADGTVAKGLLIEYDLPLIASGGVSTYKVSVESA